MDKILGVRFKKTGKLCYFNPLKFGFRIGDMIIANTERGEEIGRVVKIIDKEQISKDIVVQDIIKPATKNDLLIQKENERMAVKAADFCKEQAKKLNLNMKVLMAEYTFDGSKLTIYFSSEERVDFRELVKLLATEFRVRIDLRQVGPRDEIKSYPNLGMCGKEVCCRTHLQDFEPVTIKMAKEQGLQINMAKLSGACGRLMCCLKYEEEIYKENLKKLPRVGEFVTVDKEQGKVVAIDILGLKVKVRFGTTREDERYEQYPVEKVKWNNNKNVVEESGENEE
ncbi:MAG: stage 0 sporulation protein [Clostridia bacterium]|nr:stage 0 sporulation protein [Clostridia bacterium]